MVPFPSLTPSTSKIILILFSVLFLNQQVFAVTLFEALTEAYKNNTDLNAERENINISDLPNRNTIFEFQIAEGSDPDKKRAISIDCMKVLT